MRTSCVMRWDNGDHGLHGYIPCGADVQAEQRFGDVVIPSRLTAGWWYGTRRYEPFFEAQIREARSVT